MKTLKQAALALLFVPFMSCGGGAQKSTDSVNEQSQTNKNQTIETIMSRRSIRQYKPQAVDRDTMQTIVECGINAPNGMNKQSWAIRVVDNPEYINGITEVFKKKNQDRIANANESKENAVIETIMSRRSIRQYKPQAVNRDTMQIILDCGINAPNGQNKQSWEVRVVDNPDFINGITEIYKKENPKAAEDPKFKNMFRNASTVVFIANDPSYDLSQIDCGLLGENMILSAWSMGIGSCCLGGPTRFMTSTPAAAEYLKKLDIPEGYQLLYCIAFGYPDETPAAKPRNAAKVKFID